MAYSLALADRRDEARAYLVSIHKTLPQYGVDDFLTAMQFAPEGQLQYATEARYEVDKSGIVVADQALADRLGCAAGERWLRVEGFRYTANAPDPICWTEVFVRADYAGIGLMIGRRSGTIYSWIEDMYGVRVGSVEQTLSTETMPAAIAATLRAKPKKHGDRHSPRLPAD